MAVYYKIYLNTILFTLLTLLLLACARGESKDVVEDKADMPSENDFLKAENEYQADHVVFPTTRGEVATTSPPWRGFTTSNPTPWRGFTTSNPTPWPRFTTSNPTPWPRFTTSNPTPWPRFTTSNPTPWPRFTTSNPTPWPRFTTSNPTPWPRFTTSNPTPWPRFTTSNPTPWPRFTTSNPTPWRGFHTTFNQTPWRRFTPRRPTSRPPWRRVSTRRPSSRSSQRDCPFECDKVCVVHRRRNFHQGYVCIIPIQRGCQLCCKLYTRCRRFNVPDWICYQKALDCVCTYRTRYRNTHCFGRGRCYNK
ncbi:Hypothetical predicted protein [Paramuricea clavata]|uniref:Uncharacterized protein n=1 Tax=Paramuricea clavata TaxID=317549 RepID=A0A6S7H2V3_PARCT|nr:Hypothetical predicted protein [Paramuricea clavata]